MAIHDYLITTRRVKNGLFEAEPGPVRYLRVPSAARKLKTDHELTGRGGTARWIKEVQALALSKINPLSVSRKGDILIFVHGYNNKPEEVLKRQRQLTADLDAEGWKGVVIGFDWPSDHHALNYLEDRSDAAQVAMAMVSKGVTKLSECQAGGCQTNVHLLGHSTGAYVIMEAFAQAEKDGELYKSDWRVGQVAFISADVSAESLNVTSNWSDPMFQRVMRLTNYANPFDSILAISNAKRLGVSPKAGRVGLKEGADPKTINVHCGDHFQTIDPAKAPSVGTFNHSWYIGDRVFARDLAMTLEGAIERHAIPTRVWDTHKGLCLREAQRPQHSSSWNINQGIS